jgi:hypothetical protein
MIALRIPAALAMVEVTYRRGLGGWHPQAERTTLYGIRLRYDLAVTVA